MNCSTIAIGEITAGAVLPFFTMVVAAMPSSVQVAMPSTLTHAYVTQRLASEGSTNP